LLNRYGLGPCLFTDSVRIEAGSSPPHSHPRTLHTRYRDDPDRLLAVFLHEQMHWAVSMDDGLHCRLVGLVSGLPTNPPGGAGTLGSTYVHLLVCAGERMALGQLLGPSTADALIRRIVEERYRAVYAAVLERCDEILSEARRAGLTFRRED
jgi:hypothetical protein